MCSRCSRDRSTRRCTNWRRRGILIPNGGKARTTARPSITRSPRRGRSSWSRKRPTGSACREASPWLWTTPDWKIPMNLIKRLRYVFRKDETDAELNAEIRFHVERQTEQNIAAGMDPDEARYAALREFGGV